MNFRGLFSMPEYLMGLIFLAAFLMGLGVLLLAEERANKRVLERLKTKKQPVKTREKGKLQDIFLLSREQLRSMAESVLEDNPRLVKLELSLKRAGLKVRPGEYLIGKILLIAILGILGLLTGDLLLAILLVGISLVLPGFYLKSKATSRVRAFENQLIDGVDLIANALRSGYSFLQASEVVVKELSGPIAEEFEQLIMETRVGMSLEDALQGMNQRVPSKDLDLLITVVLIQKQVGGNLAEILEKLGNTLRERVNLKGQVRTITGQSRLSGWVIGLLPVTLLLVMYILNPEYLIPFLQHELGLVLLGVALFMEIMGLFMIKKMIQIDI